MSSQQKFHKIFILVALVMSLACSGNVNLSPVKFLSVRLDAARLESHLQNHRMIINEDLGISPLTLRDCQVVGSISNINLKGNKNLQFSFTYKLHAQNSTLLIKILAKTPTSQPIQAPLLIDLDFMIAKFPPNYQLIPYNITSYQQHIQLTTTRQYQLIFLLNGWNNFSLSGNITHSYQEGDHIYTVHYMSCVGEAGNMGWREEEDYLYFMLLLVPVENLVQKFKLPKNSYSIDYPTGYKYFYGIKGSTDEQFVGSFKERLGGVIFKAENLNKYSTYGLVFLPYPDNIVLSDQRVHNSMPIIYIIGLTVIGIVAFLLICYLLSQKCYFIKRILTIEKEHYDFEISQSTKNDLKQTDQSRHKYEINTVEEVDEKYESSLKNSYQPKVEEEPSLVLKQ